MQENTKILTCFYFWIQNSQQYYERHYPNIALVFSNIGGSNYSYDILMKRKSLRNFIGEDTFKNIKNSKIKKFEKSYDIVKMKSHLTLLKEKMNYIKKKIVKIH